MYNMNINERAQRLQIAAKAECDPRTVKRYFDGQPIRELPRLRILRALAELGIRPAAPPRRRPTTQTPPAP